MSPSSVRAAYPLTPNPTPTPNPNPNPNPNSNPNSNPNPNPNPDPNQGARRLLLGDVPSSAEELTQRVGRAVRCMGRPNPQPEP